MKPLLFTYLLAYGGSSASLVRPYIGFLIYVAFAILKPDQLWFWAVPMGNYSRTIGIALVLGWIVNGCGNWEFGRAKGIMLALLGYWLVLVIGALTAPNSDRGFAPLEPMTKTLLPVFIGLTLIDSIDKLKQLVWVIVLAQGYLAYEFNLLYYASLFSRDDITHGGLDNNGIAITMDTSIGLAFFLGMHSRLWWHRGIALGLAALMAHVVLFSHSRGGMLALLITLAASFFLIPKQPRHYVVFFLALLLVFRLAGAEVQERFASSFEENEKGGSRLDHWAACTRSMLNHPMGVGPNHWPITAPHYGLPMMAAHSTWLQMGAELGFPGIFCLGAFYGICAWRLRPFLDKTLAVPDPWLRYVARMVIASIAGFIVSAQFVTVDGIELPYYVALVGAAALKLFVSQSVATTHIAGQEDEADGQFPASAVT